MLICLNDVFSGVGGGQTYYRSLATQDNFRTISFSSHEIDKRSIEVGDNEVVVVEQTPIAAELFDKFDDVRTFFDEIDPIEQSIMELYAKAHAVRGRHFDIVEIPDFVPLGFLFPDFLRLNNVSFDRVHVGMHGTLADALDGNWGYSDIESISKLRRFDNSLYRMADARL